MYGTGAEDLDVKLLEGNSGNQIAHDQINEQVAARIRWLG
jgi:hypothetical protein